MTIRDWLRLATSKLSLTSPTPRLDAELLISYALDQSRSTVIANLEKELSSRNIKNLHELITRRLNHEPIAYIVGKSEFYGREFKVSADTLQPRPETETMIDMALKLLRTDNSILMTIVDIGTGSGCLAITAYLELQKFKTYDYVTQLADTTFFATDISKPALKIAKENAKTYNTPIKFYHGDLIEPLLTATNLRLTTNIVILANLPYVPNTHSINEAARHEPDIAIFGGVDGLDYYRQLFTQLKTSDLKLTNIDLFTESLPPQHKALSKIASQYGYKQIEQQDLIQHFRLTPKN